MPQITVQYYSDSNHLNIDGSGNPGNDGLSKHDGFSVDLNGERGQDGENSSDIILSLSNNKEKNIIEINVLGAGFYTLPLNGKITVRANGGKGGNGGRGANGHDGATGADGWDASQYSYAENGKDGGAGGNGGHGGNGGNGGKAGNITINVKQTDKDLMQLVDIEMKGGDGGYGGRGGVGGRGGLGGKGGSGCSWTEVSVYTNPDGSREQHSYIHSSMGASNGSVGAKGLAGQKGVQGKKGNDGVFNLQIENDLESIKDEISQEILPQSVVPESFDYLNFSGARHEEIFSYNRYPLHASISDSSLEVKFEYKEDVGFIPLLTSHRDNEFKLEYQEGVGFIREIPAFTSDDLPGKEENKSIKISEIKMEASVPEFEEHPHVLQVEENLQKLSSIASNEPTVDKPPVKIIAQNSKLELKMSTETKEALQIVETKESSLLGESINNTLSKDLLRYFSKSKRNLSDVNSEEYKRLFFTNQCKLSIERANNDPIQIKKALVLLKEQIVTLKKYYTWGSLFSPTSIKKIDEILNMPELNVAPCPEVRIR